MPTVVSPPATATPLAEALSSHAKKVLERPIDRVILLGDNPSNIRRNLAKLQALLFSGFHNGQMFGWYTYAKFENNSIFPCKCSHLFPKYMSESTKMQLRFIADDFILASFLPSTIFFGRRSEDIASDNWTKITFDILRGTPVAFDWLEGSMLIADNKFFGVRVDWLNQVQGTPPSSEASPARTRGPRPVKRDAAVEAASRYADEHGLQRLLTMKDMEAAARFGCSASTARAAKKIVLSREGRLELVRNPTPTNSNSGTFAIYPGRGAHSSARAYRAEDDDAQGSVQHP